MEDIYQVNKHLNVFIKSIDNFLHQKRIAHHKLYIYDH